MSGLLGGGSGVDANDLMGGNACKWNRLDVTSNLKETASQLWSSITEKGAADLGLATVSPMTGQYEENFWIPSSVCSPMPLNKEQSCFVRGETNHYKLPCVVEDPTLLLDEFTGEAIVIDFETFNCTAPLPNDGSYVIGMELTIRAKAKVHVVDEIVDEATVDLHSDKFQLKSCKILVLTADSPLQAGQQFDYSLTLTDAQPSTKVILIASLAGGLSLMALFCCCFLWCCCCRGRGRGKKPNKRNLRYGDLEETESAQESDGTDPVAQS